MGIADYAFFLFAALAVLAGLGVVFARNPVHAVLWLILAFLASAGLFVLQGAEYVAMLLVIVYVGAVAVLFLFVVMMLDIDFATFRAGMARSVPAGILIGAVLLMTLGLELGDWRIADSAPSQILAATSRPEFGKQYRSSGTDHLHRACAPVPDCGNDIAGCNGRRHRAYPQAKKRRQAAGHSCPIVSRPCQVGRAS